MRPVESSPQLVTPPLPNGVSFGEKWPAMGAHPSFSGPPGSCAGGAEHWKELRGPVPGLRALFLGHWGVAGVRARPLPRGQPAPGPALSLSAPHRELPSLPPGWLSRAAPVAAAAGGRGERGARAEEARAARTGTRRSRRRQEEARAGAEEAPRWRRAQGAWASGGGARRPAAMNLPRPSAHRGGEREPSAAARGGPASGRRGPIIHY